MRLAKQKLAERMVAHTRRVGLVWMIPAKGLCSTFSDDMQPVGHAPAVSLQNVTDAAQSRKSSTLSSCVLRAQCWREAWAAGRCCQLRRAAAIVCASEMARRRQPENEQVT